MCGRYSRKAEYKDILKHFKIIDIHGSVSYKPVIEQPPGEYITAINKDHELEEVWWTIRDTNRQGQVVNNINAKAEHVMFINMFSQAFKTDRILIPATGLYEWYTPDKGKKVKYEITFDDPIFAFGGFARNCEINGEIRRCGVIMTTTPNWTFKRIHNIKQRQAVVIRKQHYERWLDPATPYPELREMMQPLSDEETHAEVYQDPDEKQGPLF